jgi:uncharacterized membrane protein required for colicin V production
MNWVDAIVVVIFLVCAGLGFWQGFVRLLLTLVAGYVGLAVATASYGPAAGLLMSAGDDLQRSTAEVLSFSGILVITAVVLLLGGVFTFRHFHLPRRLSMVDQFSGVVLGVVTGALAVSLALLIASFSATLAHYFLATSGSNLLISVVSNGMDTSATVPVFHRLVPIISSAVRPWAPLGLPPFLHG